VWRSCSGSGLCLPNPLLSDRMSKRAACLLAGVVMGFRAAAGLRYISAGETEFSALLGDGHHGLAIADPLRGLRGGARSAGMGVLGGFHSKK